MEFNVDLKTLITVAGIVAVLGGFYYSTQYRLVMLEKQMNEISQKLDIQNKFHSENLDDLRNQEYYHKPNQPFPNLAR